MSSLLLDAAPHLSSGQHLAVFTDNVNTVQLFNSLSALPAFNWMLIQVADAVLDQGFDFQVFHVPGIHNQVADSLSCLQNAQWQPHTQGCSFFDLRWGQLHHESQAICLGQAAFSCCLVHGVPHC